MSPLKPRDDQPWYAEKGLKFRCTACGACCTGAPGYVWVRAADVARLAKFKGMQVAEFKKKYVRQVGRRMSLKERPGGDCVLLENGKCTVYPVKPTGCSTFPFWDEVVQTPASWVETALRCEGIGKGDTYTNDEVALLLSGVPEPLLEKQAAAGAAVEAGRDPDEGEEGPSVPEAAWAAAFAELEALYAALDAELPRYKFLCQASGDCCDFDAFGHRLYASTIEAEYFLRNSPQTRANEDPRHCPAWGKDRMCKARTGRMLGCRTFYCGTNKNADPNEIYERYYRRVKDVHDRHGIPFRYADVTVWAQERRPAEQR